MESIRDIAGKLKETPDEGLQGFLSAYAADERQGVQRLVEQAKGRRERFLGEQARTKRMYFFEEKYASSGLVCGIDEVGRGPLAGPVCAGAVILPAEKPLLYLNDSKKLSEKKREALYEVICREAAAYATAFVFPERIDEINILQATYEAMAAAVQGVCAMLEGRGEKERSPAVLLIDAVHVPQLEHYKQVSIIKGDAQCASIAAASIVAKVTRDRLMREYDERYPGYGFAEHKGYGSAAHMEAIRRLGPSEIHRKSFLGNV